MNSNEHTYLVMCTYYLQVNREGTRTHVLVICNEKAIHDRFQIIILEKRYYAFGVFPFLECVIVVLCACKWSAKATILGFPPEFLSHTLPPCLRAIDIVICSFKRPKKVSVAHFKTGVLQKAPESSRKLSGFCGEIIFVDYFWYHE